MKKAPYEKSMQGYLGSHPNDSRNNKQKVIDRLVKKGGLRALVDAKCCDCCYDELDAGTWRKQVEKCPIVDCPLFSVRPKSAGGHDD